MELSKAEPKDIPGLLPKLLHTVRIIWLHSEHYKSRERITALLRKVRVAHVWLVHACTYVRMSMCVYVCPCVYMFMCVYVPVCMSMSMYVYIHTYVCPCVYTYVCPCVYVYSSCDSPSSVDNPHSQTQGKMRIVFCKCFIWLYPNVIYPYIRTYVCFVICT